LIELWLQRERLHELRGQRWNAEQRQQLIASKSALRVAWRVLGGLEPVPYAARAAVALPLIMSGLETCAKVVAPSSTLAELFDEPSWQARFSSSGLSLDQQISVKNALLPPGPAATDVAVAQSALIVLRTALESAHVVERAIRKIRRRRAVVSAVFALLAATGIAALVLLRAPSGPPDLASGKPWITSSNYPGFSSAGTKPARPIEGLFFSTNDEDEPWWRLDLEQKINIDSAEIVNRSDCCADRAFPLVLELSADGKKWNEVARRNEPFSTWEPKFSPRKARYVRLRALKRTLLHLRDVRIHAAR
jgi:hypothetical protein